MVNVNAMTWAPWQQRLTLLSLSVLVGAWVSAFSQLHSLWFWGIWASITSLFGLSGFVLPKTALNESVSKTRMWWAALALFCLGGLWYAVFQHQLTHTWLSAYEPSHRGVLEVTLDAPGPQAHQWFATVRHPKQPTATARVLVPLSRRAILPASCQSGCRLRLKNPSLRALNSADFEGGFDERRYLGAYGVQGVIELTQWQVINTQPHNVFQQAHTTALQLQQRLIAQFHEALPKEQAQLLSSVVLGDHAGHVSTDIKQAFAQSGLIHLLAASGMNVGLVAAMVLWLVTLIRLPWRVGLIISMGCVLGYALMTGLPPSVQRATMMLELALFLKLIRRELAPYCLLALAGVCLIVVNPGVVDMLGFQLSFWSTWGILTMMPVIEDRLGFYITRWGALLVGVPLVAQVWVTPLSASVFNQIPLLAVFTNMVALPITAVLTYAGFFLGAVALILPHVAKPLLSGLSVLLNILTQLAVSVAQWPGQLWVVPSPPWGWVLLVMTLLWLLSWWCIVTPSWQLLPNLSWRRWVTVSSLLGLLVLTPLVVSKWHEEHRSWITWVPLMSTYNVYATQWAQVVHQSHQTIVTVPSLSSWQAKTLSRFLLHQGITRLDTLIWVAPNAATPQRLTQLAQTLRVNHVVIPRRNVLALSSATQQEFANVLLAKHITMTLLEPTSTLQAMSSDVTHRVLTADGRFYQHWGVLAGGVKPTTCWGWLSSHAKQTTPYSHCPLEIRMNRFNQPVVWVPVSNISGQNLPVAVLDGITQLTWQNHQAMLATRVH